MVKIFIGCANESISIAQTLQLGFSKQLNRPLCVIWNQGVVKPQEYVIPALIKQIRECNYAIFVFSEDDIVFSRGKKKPVARDNVVYECGLATGILGEKNCFILKSEKTVLPSDFNGITCVSFDEECYKLNHEAALGQAITQFSSSIESRSANTFPMVSWRRYIEAVEILCAKLKKSPRQGGFRYDAIVGISRGGIIAADLINRRFFAEKPLLCLWGDYKSRQPDINFSSEDVSINKYVFDAVSDQKYRNILIVDDITRCGKTVVAAKELFKKMYPSKRIECAVLFIPIDQKRKVNYYAVDLDERNTAMPYSILD